MATALNIVGQHVIDLFYQDFKGTTQFWDEEDGTYFAGVAYAELLGQEYKQVYNEMRQTGEEGIVTFSHDWLETEIVNVKNDKVDGWIAELKNAPMSFPYDKQDVGIQNIFPADSQFKRELIRSSIDTIWMDEMLPTTNDIYWALLKNRIILKSTLTAPPPALKIVYVPSVNDDLLIPDTRQNQIIQMAIQLMLGAKQGNIIKENNDQNKNVLSQTENDRNLIKG